MKVRIACSTSDNADIEDLLPLQGELKSLSKENYLKLKKQILETGFAFPVFCWEYDGKLLIVGGHQRVNTLKQMRKDGIEVPLIPIVKIHAKDLKEAKQRILQDVSQYGKVAGDSLYEFMEGAGITMDEAMDFDLPDIDLPKFKEEFYADPASSADDEVPEVPKIAKTKRGELWVLGDHRVLCGDSTNKDDVLRLMNGDMADLVVTSPPYNCGIEYDTHDDEMEIEAYYTMLNAVIKLVTEFLNQGCFVAWNVGTSRKSQHSTHARFLEDAGLRYYRQIMWLKTGVSFPMFQHTVNNGKCRNYLPNYQHEVIYLYSNGEPEEGGPCEVDDKYSTDVWDIHQSAATADIPGTTGGRGDKNAGHGSHKTAAHPAAHPAAYPVAVPAGAIKHLTSKGEVIFDPFGGAGTTLIAAEQWGRCARLMEISPNYLDLILTRYSARTGKDPVREDGIKWSELSTSPTTIDIRTPRATRPPKPKTKLRKKNGKRN